MNKPTNFAEAMNEEMKVRPVRPVTKYYYVTYGTGAGDFLANTLSEAMLKAEENVAYTQKDISIFEFELAQIVSQNDIKPILVRKWYGVPFGIEVADYVFEPLIFGNFGYYGDWE